MTGREGEDAGDEGFALAVSGEHLAEVLVGAAEHRGGGAVRPAAGLKVLAGGGDISRQAGMFGGSEWHGGRG